MLMGDGSSLVPKEGTLEYAEWLHGIVRGGRDKEHLAHYLAKEVEICDDLISRGINVRDASQLRRNVFFIVEQDFEEMFTNATKFTSRDSYETRIERYGEALSLIERYGKDLIGQYEARRKSPATSADRMHDEHQVGEYFEKTAELFKGKAEELKAASGKETAEARGLLRKARDSYRQAEEHFKRSTVDGLMRSEDCAKRAKELDALVGKPLVITKKQPTVIDLRKTAPKATA